MCSNTSMTDQMKQWWVLGEKPQALHLWALEGGTTTHPMLPLPALLSHSAGKQRLTLCSEQLKKHSEAPGVLGKWKYCFRLHQNPQKGFGAVLNTVLDSR